MNEDLLEQRQEITNMINTLYASKGMKHRLYYHSKGLRGDINEVLTDQGGNIKEIKTLFSGDYIEIINFLDSYLMSVGVIYFSPLLA